MRRGVVVVAGLIPAVLGGCELEEITIVEVGEVVVAEVYVNLAEDAADNEVRALLHWTVGVDTAGLPLLGQSRVTVRRSDGFMLNLVENEIEACVDSTPPQAVAACFLADPSRTPSLDPGDLLELEIELSSGGRMSGLTRVPESFVLDGLPSTCRLDPNSLLEVRWSRSEGAWAYLNETSIRGLPEALEAEGITVAEDPLYLLGLSISDQDTTIVFPSEFGVFNRFELDQAVAVRLQAGLPGGTGAEVTITAVDRNYVNWARGGNFNPSGQVRVPSLQGDGSGVFGSTVSRRFVVISQVDGPQALCRP